ncbi:MAG: hypothetical protein AB7F75_08010 [Planctomycetota bacterium]
MKHRWAVALLVFVSLILSGCPRTQVSTDFQGLPNARGKKFAHVRCTRLGINLMFFQPLVGDATVPHTVADFSKEASSHGATSLQICQSNESIYWWVLPPFSFIIQPVVTEVAGDAEF